MNEREQPQIICGQCHKVMTPANSKIHPEYFLCDECIMKDSPHGQSHTHCIQCGQTKPDAEFSILSGHFVCNDCVGSTPEYTGQPLGMPPLTVVVDNNPRAPALPLPETDPNPFVIPDDQIPLLRKSYESLRTAAEKSLSMVADADVYHPIWEVCASETNTLRMVQIMLSERELRMLIFAMSNVLDDLT